MTQRTRTVIPDEVKAAALADLVLLSPAAVAAKYGLKPATVRGWKSIERPALALIEDYDPSVITLKKHRITALMLEYLEAALNAQIAQAYVTADPSYINRQPAESLAILHGVLTDKAVRLVEALQSGERPAGEQ